MKVILELVLCRAKYKASKTDVNFTIITFISTIPPISKSPWPKLKKMACWFEFWTHGALIKSKGGKRKNP